MLRPPCVTHSREHTSEILNTATLTLSHSLSFFFLLSIFFLIFIPLFIVSTFSLRAPAITGLMVDGLVKFPDATAARLFGKMVAEEMIPRRLEGGGGHGGDFVLSLIIPHALVQVQDSRRASPARRACVWADGGVGVRSDENSNQRFI